MDDSAIQPPSEPHLSQPQPQPEPAEPSRPSPPVNKHDDRLQRKKTAALQKLDKVRQSFDKQLAALQQQQEADRRRAQLIEAHTAAVDAAIASVNVELARGTDWTELQRILKDERDRGNPIARMIGALDLPTNTVTLALSQSMAHVRPGWADEGRDEDRVVEVELDLSQSAYNNASNYYTQRKQQGAKASKTTETSERALRAVERRTAQQLKDSDARARIQQARRSYWWEKHHWFISSENFLVIAGRDAHQSQLIAQRHLTASDVYVCADVTGAIGVIVKNSTPAAMPPLTIQQAACMCLCRSTAWLGKPGSVSGEAWWVRGDEVEVAGEGGKVAVRASAMRRYVTRMPLVMGLAVLFRVGDECVAAHKGERRIKGGGFEELKGGEKKEEGEEGEDGKEGEEEDDDDETEEDEQQQSEENQADGDDEKAEQDDDVDDDDADEGARQRPEEARDHQDASRLSTAATKGASADVVAAAVKGLSLRGADVRTAAKQLQAASGVDKAAQSSKTQPASKQAAKSKASAADQRKLMAEDSSRAGSANSVSADDDNSSEDPRDSRAATRQQHQQQQQQQPDKTSKATKPAAQLTRAQRAKLKKRAKYADQDEEDRIIAAQVLGLQTGKRRESSNKVHDEQPEEQQQEAKHEEEVARTEGGDQEGMEPAPAPATASAPGKPTTATATAQHRGSKDKGHPRRDSTQRPKRPPTQQPDDAASEDQAAGYPLDLIDTLTGRPVESDQLQFAVCVCAPYSALLDYRYRVKLLPGSQKRGKLVQAAVAAWSRAAGGREAERDVIRGMREDEAMGVLCANVKIAAGTAGKGKKRLKDAD